MSLNYDYTACKFDGDPIISQALVFYCMALGQQGITEANWQGFALRMRFHDALFGPLLCTPEGDVSISDDDIRAHIGLKTNVGNEPLTRWSNRMTKLWLDDQQGIIARRGNTRHLYVPAQPPVPPPPAPPSHVESDICPECGGEGCAGHTFEAGAVVEWACACAAKSADVVTIPF